MYCDKCHKQSPDNFVTCAYCGAKLKSPKKKEPSKFIKKREFKFNLPLKNGAYSLLQKLKAEGVKMCVCTSTHRFMMQPALDRLGFIRVGNSKYGIFRCDMYVKSDSSAKGTGISSGSIYDLCGSGIGCFNYGSYHMVRL